MLRWNILSLQENSYGPDVLIRISNTRDTFASSKEKKENKSEEASVEKNIVYLIGVSWESCPSSDLSSSRAMVKEKVVNFIYQVSSQLELEKNDIRVIQFIVGDKYSECLFERFSCDRKWILCSGSYYEDDLGGLECRQNYCKSYWTPRFWKILWTFLLIVKNGWMKVVHFTCCWRIPFLSY